MRNKIIELEDINIDMIEAGPRDGSAMMFLHGWPQSSRAFESVMNLLSADFHIVAIDLPGVGRSTGYSLGDKRIVAGYVHAVIQAAGLTDVTLVGHDVGGQIVYAYLHEFPKAVRHEAETLVAGHQKEYFEFFYDALAAAAFSRTKRAIHHGWE